MWTNDPFWLFMLKGLMERARPILNWVLSLWIIGVLIAAFMAVSVIGGMANAMNPYGSSGDDSILLLWGLIDSSILWAPALLILILLNIKFSIRWRQER